MDPRYAPYKECLKTSRLHGWPGPPGQPGVGERGQVRARGHVREGVPGHIHERGHRHRRRPAQADLQDEVGRWPSAPRRSPGPHPPRAGRARCGECGRARGRLQLAHAGARRPLSPRVRRVPVLLRYLPEPAAPAGGPARRVRGAGQLRLALARERCSGRSRGTPSSTSPSRRCSSSSAGLAMALIVNQSFRGRGIVRAFLLLPIHRAHRATAPSRGCGSSTPRSAC